jgi:hypothetical protein
LRALVGILRGRWYLLIGAILLVAAAIRFSELDKVPLPLADEIVAAVDIHYLVTTGHHFDGSHAGILAYITPALDGRFAVAFLGGTTVADLRGVAAMFGVLTVGLLVWLGHELGDFKLGIIGAGALAIMPWHIYYSRIFFPASEYLFFTVLVICLELTALRRRSVTLGIASALAAVASIYIYPVAIVSTPLLIASVLVFRWREVRKFGLLRSLAPAAMCAGVLALPYVIDHLVVTDPAVGTANGVLAAKMVWNHGLPVTDVALQFLSSWANYLSPSYLLFRGDPNVVQSIQTMGEVGWVLGLVGCLGIVVGVQRRSALDLQLIVLTAIYPVADALTYFDALGNSVRGITGSVIWALWIAIAVQQLLRMRANLYRAAAIVAAVVAVVIQSYAFASYYFGTYTVDYAYAFETGYEPIYTTLVSHNLETVPITLHAGYERQAMLEYFSQYRLRATQSVLACQDLPFDVLNYTVLPRIFIVREDRGFAAYPDCVNQTGLIDRDETALRSVVPDKGGSRPRKFDVIAVFPNDPQGDYFTAIWYVHY